MQPDEIDDITTRLAAETHEVLAFDVHKEARTPVLVERAEPLPAMRSRSFQADSSSLHDVKQRVGELDRRNIRARTVSDVVVMADLPRLSTHHSALVEIRWTTTTFGLTSPPSDRRARADWSSPDDARPGSLRS